MAKASLVNSVLINLGLKEAPKPASFWSLFLLYFTLVFDVLFILARIITIILFIRDWCRKSSEIRQTFFVFVVVYCLIDIPRIGLYSSPILFTYGSTNSIKNLLLIADYYRRYWNLARTLCLMAISWNRFAVLVFGQRPAWNIERSGPTMFLLVLMPLLPTIICSTIPEKYGNMLQNIFCYVCLGISALCLFFAFLAVFRELCRPKPMEHGKLNEIILMVFPLWVLFATILCYSLEAVIVKSTSSIWTKTDTNKALITGIEVLYTLFIDTISFIGLFIISSKFRNAIFKSPIAKKQ